MRSLQPYVITFGWEREEVSWNIQKVSQQRQKPSKCISIWIAEKHLQVKIHKTRHSKYMLLGRLYIINNMHSL